MDKKRICQILSFFANPVIHAGLNLTSEAKFYEDLWKLKTDGYLLPTSEGDITIDPKTNIQSINFTLSDKGKDYLKNECVL